MASIGDWQSTLVTIAEWASQPANGPVLASGVVLYYWRNKPLAGGLEQFPFDYGIVAELPNLCNFCIETPRGSTSGPFLYCFYEIATARLNIRWIATLSII